MKRPNGSLGLAIAAWTILIFMALPTILVVPMSFNEAAYLQFPPKGYSLRWYEDRKSVV